MTLLDPILVIGLVSLVAIIIRGLAYPRVSSTSAQCTASRRNTITGTQEGERPQIDAVWHEDAYPQVEPWAQDKAPVRDWSRHDLRHTPEAYPVEIPERVTIDSVFAPRSKA